MLHRFFAISLISIMTLDQPILYTRSVLVASSLLLASVLSPEWVPCKRGPLGFLFRRRKQLSMMLFVIVFYHAFVDWFAVVPYDQATLVRFSTRIKTAEGDRASLVVANYSAPLDVQCWIDNGHASACWVLGSIRHYRAKFSITCGRKDGQFLWTDTCAMNLADFVSTNQLHELDFFVVEVICALVIVIGLTYLCLTRRRRGAPLFDGRDQLTCAVCRDDLAQDGHKIRRLPCNHDFHDQCAASALKSRPMCPVCAAPMPEHIDLWHYGCTLALAVVDWLFRGLAMPGTMCGINAWIFVGVSRVVLFDADRKTIDKRYREYVWSALEACFYAALIAPRAHRYHWTLLVEFFVRVSVLPCLAKALRRRSAFMKPPLGLQSPYRLTLVTMSMLIAVALFVIIPYPFGAAVAIL